MRFIKKLLGKGHSAPEKQEREEVTEESETLTVGVETQILVREAKISGTEVGGQISKLAIEAEAEGWHPVASLQVICNLCEYQVELDFEHPTAGEAVGFKTMSGYKSLDTSLLCDNCGASEFRIVSRQFDFQDWLFSCVDNLPPCGDDPTRGFRNSETGELIKDHHFRLADTSEELWENVSPHVDKNGVLKDKFTFNYMDIPGVGSRRINRTTGVAHQNTLTHELIVIIKDSNNRLWYRIEHE